MQRFADRAAAGRALAARLVGMAGTNAVVLALPRGGVAVALPIAAALGAPLDLVLVRKIGAPGQPELAIGAIADGPVAELVTEARLLRAFDISAEWLAASRARETAEMERRRAAYLGGRRREPVAGRVAILVDDGLATGATMLAALRAVRRCGPARLVVAVPVAAADSLARCAAEADETVCLRTPRVFGAVGAHYRAFPQLTDAEVIALLDQVAAARAGEVGAGPAGS